MLFDEHMTTKHLNENSVIPTTQLPKIASDLTCEECNIAFVRKKNFENHITRFHTSDEHHLQVEEAVKVDETLPSAVVEETEKFTCTRYL